MGRSESWLSKVERGERSADKFSVLLDLAEVLGVEVDALTGEQPTTRSTPPPATTDRLDEMRRAFAGYQYLLGDPSTPLGDPTEFRTTVAALHERYQAARYDAVLATLPALIRDVELRRATVTSGEHQREASLAYVSTYVLSAKLLTKLGATDLALLAADRAASAACIAGSDLADGLAAYQVACALLQAGQLRDAELVATGVGVRLEHQARTDAPGVVSIAGALFLIGAVVAARRLDRLAAWEHLDRAARLARVLGRDGNHHWTAFGPTNVSIHRVSVAVELGDVGEALSAADSVDESLLPSSLVGRRAQVHLDLATAHAQRRRDADATLHLLEAERIAPQAVGHNPRVQAVVREMLSRSARSRTTALAQLAQRTGLLR